MEQLTGMINVFSPEDRRRRKQTGEHWLGEQLGPSYHGHHLEVLHIRPFCCQQLLGDEVGSICWEPLQGHHKRGVREQLKQRLVQSAPQMSTSNFIHDR